MFRMINMMSSSSSSSSEESEDTTFVAPKWLEELEASYPLPEAQGHQCRDAYLKEFLKPFEDLKSSETESSSYDMEIGSGKVRFDSSLSYIPHYFGADVHLVTNLIINQRLTMLKRATRLSGIKQPFDESSRYTVILDINKMLKERYDDIAAAVGLISVLIQFKELEDRLTIVRESWPLNANVDRSLRLFSWSIEDYLYRFHLPSAIYLDTAELELKNVVECYKFRMDLKEILRLIEALSEDAKAKRDICKNSMVVIRDAETDIKDLLMKSQQEAERQSAQLKVEAVTTPLRMHTENFKYKILRRQVNFNDAYLPIEARYRINLAQSVMEQEIMHDEQNIQKLSDDLNWLRKSMAENSYIRDITSISYDSDINIIRARIVHMEVTYEEYLSHVEGCIQGTRLKLAKIKDDLKYHKEQIPKFHKEIAAVQAVLAKGAQSREPNTLPTSKSQKRLSLSKKRKAKKS